MLKPHSLKGLAWVYDSHSCFLKLSATARAKGHRLPFAGCAAAGSIPGLQSKVRKNTSHYGLKILSHVCCGGLQPASVLLDRCFEACIILQKAIARKAKQINREIRIRKIDFEQTVIANC
jgi:hypothetical protein